MAGRPKTYLYGSHKLRRRAFLPVWGKALFLLAVVGCKGGFFIAQLQYSFLIFFGQNLAVNCCTTALMMNATRFGLDS
jgi:hypothetical protein